MAFDAEAWAKTQPHAFYSRWPMASRTKCDFCGTYYAEHPDAPAPDDDVAKHPTKAVRGGDPEWMRRAREKRLPAKVYA